MSDFDQEIENRLRHFQWLNGKGNVKDCNHTLYEIMRLMLGMLAQNKSASTAPRADAADEPVITLDTAESLSEPVADDDNIAITSDVLMHPTVTEAIQPFQTLHAPFGLTKFGNPKRDRSRHKK